MRDSVFANKCFLFGTSMVTALVLAAQTTLALLVWINSCFSPLFVTIFVTVMPFSPATLGSII